jgi:uncharacterized protein
VNGKTALDFTVPEALLLIEQVASRYRDHLKGNVPFADQVSLNTLYSIWQHREWAQLAIGVMNKSYRLGRIFMNPTAGVMREIERVASSGNSNYISAQAMSVFQTVLLEEVAFTAVELYSGRLRYSNAELLEIQISETAADRTQISTPDGPLRIVVAGQTNSGKSSLINALLKSDLAETDTPPTTEHLKGYETVIDGVECIFIDTPGLDGSIAARDLVLNALTENADIIVWVSRSNRPSRSIDQTILKDLKDWFMDRSNRRMPPVITVASFVDQLTVGWPFPEHTLPNDVQLKFAEAVAAISSELGVTSVHPVSAIMPEWNIDPLRRSLVGMFGEGLMTQRNRMRINAAGTDGVLAEISRGGRGLLKSSQLLGGRFIRKALTEK